MKKLKRDVIIGLFSNIAVAAVIVFVFAFTIVPGSTAPTAGKGYEPYYNGNRNSDGVSLMFNVYENTAVVEGILETLEEYGATATFFVGGCWADDNTECLKKIVAGGHELANHGYFHKDHSKLSLEQNKEEIRMTEVIVQALCGVKTSLFAPPSGAFGKNTLAACSDMEYRVIMWSKDTIDWRDHDENVVYKRATENVEGGELILMHPKEHTLKALPRILSYYEKEGLKTVMVSQNIGE